LVDPRKEYYQKFYESDYGSFRDMTIIAPELNGWWSFI